MRTKVLVVTNNPAADLCENDRPLTGSLLQVLQIARDLVHQGHILISHPLAGSVKPNETPYKSIVLSSAASGQVDYESLAVIEGSLRIAERMLAEKPLPEYPERVLKDFQLIDCSLLEQALQSIPGYL
ncbi:MAG: GrdX family protein [Bacillota bacterium]